MKNKWMIQAMILGFSFFIAILLVKPIGVSTQFSVISGKIHVAINNAMGKEPLIVKDESAKNGFRSSNAYYDKDGGKLAKSIAVGVDRDLAFFISIFAGAILAKFALGKKNSNREFFDNSEILDAKTITKSFVAGFLLLYGARMAGGCTSGHMMSGMMQSSLSGFLFAAFVFAIAIPVAIGGEKR